MRSSSLLKPVGIFTIVTVLAGAIVLRQAVPGQAASPPAIPRCSNVQLLIRSFSSQGALGHIEIVFRLKDIVGGPCGLQGYPGVELLDRDFHSLPTHLQRGHGYIITNISARPVILTPRHDAYFALEYHDVPTNNQPCPTSPYLMIIPPDDNLPDVTYTGGAAPCSGDVVVSPIVSKPPFS